MEWEKPDTRGLGVGLWAHLWRTSNYTREITHVQLIVLGVSDIGFPHTHHRLDAQAGRDVAVVGGGVDSDFAPQPSLAHELLHDAGVLQAVELHGHVLARREVTHGRIR